MWNKGNDSDGGVEEELRVEKSVCVCGEGGVGSGRRESTEGEGL